MSPSPARGSPEPALPPTVPMDVPEPSSRRCWPPLRHPPSAAARPARAAWTPPPERAAGARPEPARAAAARRRCSQQSPAPRHRHSRPDRCSPTRDLGARRCRHRRVRWQPKRRRRRPLPIVPRARLGRSPPSTAGPRGPRSPTAATPSLLRRLALPSCSGPAAWRPAGREGAADRGRAAPHAHGRTCDRRGADRPRQGRRPAASAQRPRPEAVRRRPQGAGAVGAPAGCKGRLLDRAGDARDALARERARPRRGRLHHLAAGPWCPAVAAAAG